MENISCHGKVGHRTFTEAKKHIAKPYKSGKRDKLSAQKIDVYRCPDCHLWHVGKTIRTQYIQPRNAPYKRGRLHFDI